jgi:hypothetical protein
VGPESRTRAKRLAKPTTRGFEQLHRIALIAGWSIVGIATLPAQSIAEVIVGIEYRFVSATRVRSFFENSPTPFLPPDVLTERRLTELRHGVGQSADGIDAQS